MQLNVLRLIQLLLFVEAFATSGVSAFVPIGSYHRSAAAASQHSNRPTCGGDHTPKQHKISQTVIQMSYKSPDEGSSYNDDAFGFVFLIGGVLSQDVDFAATFAFLSAIAAVGTKVGFINKDEKAPAAVAALTLLTSPLVSSLRQTGSLESIAAPMPVEIGICTISAVWAFVNASRKEES